MKLIHNQIEYLIFFQVETQRLKCEFEPESKFSLYLIFTKTEVNVVPEVDEDEDCQEETEERDRVANLRW